MKFTLITLLLLATQVTFANTQEGPDTIRRSRSTLESAGIIVRSRLAVNRDGRIRATFTNNAGEIRRCQLRGRVQLRNGSTEALNEVVRLRRSRRRDNRIRKIIVNVPNARRARVDAMSCE